VRSTWAFHSATEWESVGVTASASTIAVYIELPSDIAYLDVVVPADPLTLADAPSDPERLRSCVAAIVGRLSAAKSPAILVDADADRFGVASELMGLVEKMQVPIAVINTAKSVIDETFPYYLGIYIGKPSEPHVREAIETSDCLLAIDYRPLETYYHWSQRRSINSDARRRACKPPSHRCSPVAVEAGWVTSRARQADVMRTLCAWSSASAWIEAGFSLLAKATCTHISMSQLGLKRLDAYERHDPPAETFFSRPRSSKRAAG
jgi:TPP-dependent trihydroxycyclohexane-1,2-dione (THcHDO) dehydratase